MGRWAQRSIRGGGSQQSTAIIQINAAIQISGLLTILYYSGDVTASEFDTAAFESLASHNQPDTITQGDSEQLQLTWGADTTGDTDIEYTGNTPGVLTPQTIAY